MLLIFPYFVGQFSLAALKMTLSKSFIMPSIGATIAVSYLISQTDCRKRRKSQYGRKKGIKTLSVKRYFVIKRNRLKSEPTIVLKMKEININIEGYNVNGICVGCLNYNRKMFYSEKVTNCFKTIANIDVPDGLTIQVCWECLAAVRAVERFQTQILESYDILIDYSRQHTFLNSPSDLSKHARSRLTVSAVPVDQDVKVEVEVAIKQEAKEEAEDLEEFPGADTVKSEVDIFEDGFPQDHEDAEVASEDDIKLSKLKKKKERRIKKKKKRDVKIKTAKIKTEKALQRNTRKLKNLPSDLVELYTMSEEEMWQIRNEDVTSKEFCALRYRCDDCVIGFNSEKLMNDHMAGKHSPKGPESHQCDVCKAFFLTKDNVYNHRALHLSAYRCVQCGLQTALKRRIVTHTLTHRQGGDKCDTCGEEFSSKSKLAYHKFVCNQERPECDCCGKVFANKMTLKYHLNCNLKKSSWEESDNESIGSNCTPPELRDEAASALDYMLPAKSKEKYIKAYETFIDWKHTKGAYNFSETVFIAYFNELSKTKKPPTLWVVYTMLKCTVNMAHNVDIKHYKNLASLLKRKSSGYKAEKSKILTAAHVEEFLNDAPDDKYLAIKVALVLGINGACRSKDLTYLTTGNIEINETNVVLKLRDTETKIDRDDFINIVRKYAALRPNNTKSDRFFLNYKDGKCFRQPIGRHTIALMPRQIATFLNLPDAGCYNGHCFRNSSATLLADSGAKTTLKRHVEWDSDGVAEKRKPVSHTLHQSPKPSTSRHVP